MEYTKAFEYISKKVEEELAKQNYTKQKVSNEDGGDLVSLFTSENVAYSVVYILDKQQMVLRSAAMTDDGPDNDWKTLATWLYDEQTADQKDAMEPASTVPASVSSAVRRITGISGVR